MKEGTIRASLSDKKRFNITENFELEILVKENKYNIPVSSLLGMAARKNKKRGFLFVSKVLGKHIPVNPNIPKIGGHILAHLFMEEIEKKKGPDCSLLVKALSSQKYIKDAASFMEQTSLNPSEATLFLGFAETATGLGHAMYSAFTGQAGFIHTTRDNIKELKSVFSFDEEHSHATLHLCYTTEKNFISKFKRIVLVDDEITTGKTALNLIRSLHRTCPCRHYTVASLLDWRSEEHIENYRLLEKELNITINSLSLVKGNIKYNGTVEDVGEVFYNGLRTSIKVDTIQFPLEDKSIFTLIDTFAGEHRLLYSRLNGRFGIETKDNKEINTLIEHVASTLKEFREGSCSLCLGCNEFIFIPSAIASKMGDKIYYQSSTRSPIYPANRKDYAVKSAITFKNHYDEGIVNYIYNILPGKYDEVFFFLERDINKEKKEIISGELAKYGIKFLKFVTFI